MLGEILAAGELRVLPHTRIPKRPCQSAENNKRQVGCVSCLLARVEHLVDALPKSVTQILMELMCGL